MKSVAKKFANFLLDTLMVAAAVVLVGYFAPEMLSKGVAAIRGEAARRVDVEEMILPKVRVKTEETGHKVTPVYDLGLPEGRWIRTTTAEKGAIIEAEVLLGQDINDKREVNEILDRGVFLYGDFADIGWSGKTVLIAGHRWVGLTQREKQHSFANLHKVSVGDRVELIDDYKRWTYEVYKVEEAKEISEMEADLILYTCVWWWDNPERLFVYAKIVE